MGETGENKGALRLRAHLAAAKVEHPHLTLNSATHMPIGFRSWRDTGIAWSAIDGIDVYKLQRRAGHDDVNTTLGYCKEAEDRSKLQGRVFLALPNELVWPDDWPEERMIPRENRPDLVPEEGVEGVGARAHRDFSMDLRGPLPSPR